jgi:hypothetical protein
MRFTKLDILVSFLIVFGVDIVIWDKLSEPSFVGLRISEVHVVRPAFTLHNENESYRVTEKILAEFQKYGVEVMEHTTKDMLRPESSGEGEMVKEDLVLNRSGGEKVYGQVACVVEGKLWTESCKVTLTLLSGLNATAEASRSSDFDGVPNPWTEDYIDTATRKAMEKLARKYQVSQRVPGKKG